MFRKIGVSFMAGSRVKFPRRAFEGRRTSRGTSFLPASSIILLSLFVKPHSDAGRRKHQHRVERVHDLLESLHQSPPLSEFPLVRTPCRPGLTGFFESPPHAA